MRLISWLIVISLCALAPQTRGQTTQTLTEQGAALELNEQGVRQAQARRYEEAVASIQEAIRRGPRLSGLHRNLGVAYINWGRPSDALQPLRDALELEPECGESYFYLGVVNTELSRHAEAIRNYEQAIRHGWIEAAVYSNLGWSYYLLGNSRKGLESLRIAADLAPGDVKILNNLGVVHASGAQYDEAAKALRQVLLLRPDLALARYNLGRVYLAQNNRAGALEQYNILKSQASDLGKDLHKRIYRDLLVAIDK